MHVLEIISDSTLSGGPKHLLALVGNLNKDIAAAVVCPKGFLAEQLSQKKIKHFILDLDSSNDFAQSIKLARLIKTLKPKIIHAHGIKAGWQVYLATFFSSFNYIYSEHLFTEDYHLCSSVREFFQVQLLSIICRKARKVVVPSLAVKRFLVGQRRIKDSKIIHIPNGLDDFKVKLIPQGQVIGFIGSFNKNKGLPILISAMNKVKEEIPSVRLELVGAGDLRSVSGGQAQILGSTIVFLDQIDNIAEIMGGWRLLVVPSLTEAFGQVAVEAGIAGLPAVVSNAGGLPEIISNGVNGLVVPRGNICKLSDAIVEILQNQSLAGKMGRQNRLVYEKCFTAVLMGQRFSSLYEKSYD